MTANPQPWGAMWRCLDTLRDIDHAALGGLVAEQCEGSEQAVRYYVAAWEAVLATHPGVAERIEGDLAKAAAAMGVEG